MFGFLVDFGFGLFVGLTALYVWAHILQAIAPRLRRAYAQDIPSGFMLALSPMTMVAAFAYSRDYGAAGTGGGGGFYVALAAVPLVEVAYRKSKKA